MTAEALPLFRISGTIRRRWARRNAWTLGVLALLIIMLVVEKLVHPAMGAFEVQTLVLGALPLALAAMAQGTIVISGGIDLSIGYQMSLVSVIGARWMVNASFTEAVLISLAIIAGTVLAGAFTGSIISLTRVPDIVVTLAMGFIWLGIALEVMPVPGGGAPLDWQNLATGEVWTSVPEGLFVLIGVWILVWLPFARSRPGLAIFALGSNRNAAYLSGISVARTRIIAYSLGGVFTALAGLALIADQYGIGNANSGASYTLNSVAAIVLGGVSLTGGRGGMVGPMAAAFVLQTVNSILVFLGYDPNYASVIQGIIVILVVMFAGLVLVRRRD